MLRAIAPRCRRRSRRRACRRLVLAQARMGNRAATARSMREARASCKETPAALLNFATALLHIGETAEAANLAARCIEPDDSLDLDRLRDSSPSSRTAATSA